MENLNEDGVHLQCFKSLPGERFITDVSSNSEREQQCPPESNQEPPAMSVTLPVVDPIEFRMQQLHNRRFLLLKIQRCIKKEQNNDGTVEETTEEDGDEHCELQAIQRELEELEVKKKEKNRGGSKPQAKTGHQDNIAPCKETPRGGIYMLPPPQPDQRGGVVTGMAETATHTIVPVENLGETRGVAKCPSCESIVLTETHSSVGEGAWISCVLCFMMGCVAGCCLIPFYSKRLRNVQHRCPMCQAHINTHQPF